MQFAEPLDERSQRIVDAALGLLREGGPAGMTTDAVAARADVSKATIYKRWRSKSELIVAVVDSVIEPLVIPDMGSTEAEIRAFLHQRMKQFEKPGVQKVFASILGMSAEDPVLAERFHRWVHGQMSANTEILRRGVERGEINTTHRMEDLSTLIAAPMVYRLVWEGQTPAEGLLDTIVTSLLAAIGTDRCLSPKARTA